jgi:CDGSH-type Zn-finger protein/uncharacterized Fe-S cluster protein YjdI
MPKHEHRYRGKEIEVTWDGKRCIHAAECLLRLPKVFNIDEYPWVQPDKAEADKVAQVVMRCPTGSLHFVRKDGVKEQPPAKNTLEIRRNGPLYLHGDIVIVEPNGNTIVEDTRVALCRCGRSANKPFCDDMHMFEFHDEGEINPTMAVITEAPADGKVTITPSHQGPLEVAGVIELRGKGGAVMKVENPLLCRCGTSSMKPFCDGSHAFLA